MSFVQRKYLDTPQSRTVELGKLLSYLLNFGSGEGKLLWSNGAAHGLMVQFCSNFLTLLYIGEKGVIMTPLPTLKPHSSKRKFGLVQSPNEFGHMGTNYDQFPENASKFQQSLSYTSCDELIKNKPCEVGLKYYFFQCKFEELHLSRRIYFFS